MNPRILVMTAGHLATCPRMLKAADALAEHYDVRVVSARHEGWASDVDRVLHQTRRWRWSVVDYGHASAGGTYLWSGVRFRGAGGIARVAGATRIPMAVVVRAYSRVHTELVRAALAEPFDFIYGGTTGALGAVADAARRAGVPYAIDLEDFHGGEHGENNGRLANTLARRVERGILGGATFVTTASEAIAEQYRASLGISPAVINNTFSLPDRIPDFSRAPDGRLRLYWFSQTIGPGRGLDDAIAAMGRTALPGELHVRGRALSGYLDALRGLAAACAPRLAITHHPPASADAMVDLARGHDVGLALEQMAVVNRQLCLTNKAFTYILAGMAVALTDTPGQHALGVDLGPAAAVVPPADVDALAAAFARWASDPCELERAKRAAWEAAVRRWHWEHPLERGALLELVRHSLS